VRSSIENRLTQDLQAVPLRNQDKQAHTYLAQYSSICMCIITILSINSRARLGPRSTHDARARLSSRARLGARSTHDARARLSSRARLGPRSTHDARARLSSRVRLDSRAIPDDCASV